MKNKKAKNQNISSTEKYLFVSTVRDDTAVLKNGGLRAVLLTSSINFALKNEDEQQGIVQGYVALLNSLDFPLQICIQSRKLNIDRYLMKIDTQYKKTTNDLMKIQLQEYKRYIVELLDLGDIMSKRFYIVIPYEPGSSSRKKSFTTQLSEVLAPTKAINLSKKQFAEYKNELERRVALVQSGLQGMGLTSVRLDTQGLIETLYNTYNPIVSQFEKVSDINEIKLEN
jgi:hypothetical protein